MCLAVPGKIIKIEGDIATIDYGSETRKAAIVEDNYKIGDYVIVQGKIVIEKVPKKDVKQWLEMFDET